jgi:hypothetical protein
MPRDRIVPGFEWGQTVLPWPGCKQKACALLYWRAQAVDLKCILA